MSETKSGGEQNLPALLFGSYETMAKLYTDLQTGASKPRTEGTTILATILHSGALGNLEPPEDVARFLSDYVSESFAYDPNYFNLNCVTFASGRVVYQDRLLAQDLESLDQPISVISQLVVTNEAGDLDITEYLQVKVGKLNLEHPNARRIHPAIDDAADGEFA